MAPCDAFCDGPRDCGTLGDVAPPESLEQAASTGMMAAAATASTFADRRGFPSPPSRLRKPVAHLLGVTQCTVAGGPTPNHRHADSPALLANSQVALPNTTSAGAVCESNGMLWALLRRYTRPYRSLLAIVAG